MHISHLHGEAQEMHCHIQTLLSILWTTHIIIAHTWWKLHLPPQSHVGSSYVVHPYHPVLRISLVKWLCFHWISSVLSTPSKVQHGRNPAPIDVGHRKALGFWKAPHGARQNAKAFTGMKWPQRARCFDELDLPWYLKTSGYICI